MLVCFMGHIDRAGAKYHAGYSHLLQVASIGSERCGGSLWACCMWAERMLKARACWRQQGGGNLLDANGEVATPKSGMLLYRSQTLLDFMNPKEAVVSR